jgi:Zn-dependent protease with chaperone function
MKRMVRTHEFAADQHALSLCKVNDSGAWSLCQGLTETRQRLSMNGYPSINDRIQRIVDWQVKEGEKEFNMMNYEKN